mgnify:CR=1 FL=1
MPNSIDNVIESLVKSKLGDDHPRTQELIEKHQSIAKTVAFSDTEEDTKLFQKICQDIQDDMAELGRLKPLS